VGAPSPVSRDALALLARAADDGLDPADYDSVGLERLADGLVAARPPLAEDVASFDMTLSASVLRHFRHLHLGRIDPRTLGLRLNVPVDEHDFVNVLLTAMASGLVAKTAADLAPALVQYHALRSALTRYRALSFDRSLGPLPELRAAVHPGDRYAGVARLHRRLVALGDLPPGASLDAATYEGPVVEGVKRFQVRHGLDPDGVLGKATYAALSVPLLSRARQIELALERLRWLPDLGDERFLALNIPMFHLWAWDSIPPDGAPLFGMRAIVGRALRTETPVFVEEMRHVIFRPYWNVPSSILRQEILPIVGRDPDYLRRQNMEIVRGGGDAAPPVPATPENVELLRKGSLRLRQRPGPRNALGLVKFVFPNNENVYLHGTPAQELFSRTRRDFSHGCVRVEDPVALASWVLKDQPEWTRDRILAAMSGADSQSVQLARPIRVILFYTTAVVMPEDGAVHFSEDIYGHDRKLDQALARR
jgi:murein L,D-transpeptidase YcbB/YkuD